MIAGLALKEIPSRVFVAGCTSAARADRRAVRGVPTDVAECGLGFCIGHPGDLREAECASCGGEEKVLRHDEANVFR